MYMCIAFSNGFGCIKGFFYLNKIGSLQNGVALPMKKKSQDEFLTETKRNAQCDYR